MTFQVPWKLVLISAVVGILAAIALGGVAFAAAPHFDAVSVYFAPARLTIFVVEPLIPSRLMYWLVPDGGAVSGKMKGDKLTVKITPHGAMSMNYAAAVTGDTMKGESYMENNFPHHGVKFTGIRQVQADPTSVPAKN
jgi:hypothetical protein